VIYDVLRWLWQPAHAFVAIIVIAGIVASLAAIFDPPLEEES
jgi:hypothetical protein